MKLFAHAPVQGKIPSVFYGPDTGLDPKEAGVITQILFLRGWHSNVGTDLSSKETKDKVISESVESFGKNTQLHKGWLTELVKEDDIELRSELRGRKIWIEHSRKRAESLSPKVLV